MPTDNQTNTATQTNSQTNNLTDAWQMNAADALVLAQNKVRLPMGYAQLKRYLPHRYPFMLVDRVTHCRPGYNILGYKNISINEPYFQGHFPEQPIMPGVLMIEAMAQLSGILGFISERVTYEDGYLFLFAGVDKARFKQPVRSGDRLTLQSELQRHKQDIYKFSCHAYVDASLAASAQLTLVRTASPLQAPHAAMSEKKTPLVSP